MYVNMRVATVHLSFCVGLKIVQTRVFDQEQRRGRGGDPERVIITTRPLSRYSLGLESLRFAYYVISAGQGQGHVIQYQKYLLWNVILGIVALIGQSAKQEDLVADQCKTMSQSRTRGLCSIFWCLGLQLAPFPLGRLQLIQFIRVLAVLDHSAKDVNLGAVHHKPIRCATRGHITLGRWHVPLVGG